MPRCQRTLFHLRNGDSFPGQANHAPGSVMRWVCPHCADAEIYDFVTEPDLQQYARLAEIFCKQEFGNPTDAPRPYALFYGLRPECVLEQSDRRYDIYLQRDCDPFQLRLQIGHEMFHRICSQGRVFHWTHEMLACLTAVRLLRRCGNPDYADTIARDYAEQSEALSFAAMREADLSAPPYPEGLYGRAFMTGLALQEAVGWNLLRRLGRSMDKRGEPDIFGWLSRLPAELIAPATALMNQPIYEPGRGAEISQKYHAG